MGLNLAFMSNRLSFDMAYYNKNTTDDIAVVTTSSASGFGSKYERGRDPEPRISSSW